MFIEYQQPGTDGFCPRFFNFQGAGWRGTSQTERGFSPAFDFLPGDSVSTAPVYNEHNVPPSPSACLVGSLGESGLACGSTTFSISPGQLFGDFLSTQKVTKEHGQCPHPLRARCGRNRYFPDPLGPQGGQPMRGPAGCDSLHHWAPLGIVTCSMKNPPFWGGFLRQGSSFGRAGTALP